MMNKKTTFLAAAIIAHDYPMTIDTLLAVSDAKVALSRSGTFKMVAQVRALNDAVSAGIVFG